MEKTSTPQATAPALSSPRFPGCDTLTCRQVADLLNRSEKMLENMRRDGTGPAFVRLSKKRIVYRLDTVRAWMEAREVLSTSAPFPGAD